jgi:hypothetical protein
MKSTPLANALPSIRTAVATEEASAEHAAVLTCPPNLRHRFILCSLAGVFTGRPIKSTRYASS